MSETSPQPSAPSGDEQPAPSSEPSAQPDTTPDRAPASTRTWLIRVGVFALFVGVLGFALDQRYGHRDRIIEAEADVSPPIAQVDGFNRPDADELAPQALNIWLQPNGDAFGIRGGAAALTGALPQGGAFAVSSLPPQEDASLYPIGAFGLTIRSANTDSGVVLRFRDPQHYWLLSPHPTLGTWVISKIDGETRTEVMTTRFQLGMKDVTVWIEFRGDAIIVRSHGKLQAVVTDATYADAASVGFVAAGPSASSVRFDNAVLAFPADA